MTDHARRLPRNVEAEAALLGAMMIDNRLADDIVGQLEAQHFFEPLHGRVFAAIQALRAKDQLASPITLRPLFDADPAMTELGGVSYLARLTGSGAGLIGARQFAKQIFELAMLRALAEIGTSLVDRALDTSEDIDPAAQVESAEALLSQVRLAGSTARPAIGFAQAWDHAIRRVRDVGAGKVDDRIVIAGLSAWNDICGGGMFMGQLLLLGGRPSMGKTAAALAVARHAAEAGHGVLFISLEMSVEQLMSRMLADLLFEAGAAATARDIVDGKVSEADFAIAKAVRARIGSWPLIIEAPEARLTAAMIGPMVRQHKRMLERRGQQLRLVVVDYLGLLAPSARRDNREQETSDTSRELKAAATANGVALLALAQLNRGVEQRDDKRPLINDLRDSGSLEQDADSIIFAYRPQYYLERSEPSPTDKKRDAWELELAAERDRLYLYSVKVRQGEIANRRFYWFGPRQAIRPDDYYRTGSGSWGSP